MSDAQSFINLVVHDQTAGLLAIQLYTLCTHHIKSCSFEVHPY